jgi:Na+/H+ antiporter NhaD and related arsenite permeases
VLRFIKKEPVFSITFLLTALTFLSSRPSLETVKAIDFRMLSLLFVLMAVSSGLRESGFFGYLASTLSKRVSTLARFAILMISLVFFSSMVLTNDVALLVFVPFTLLFLKNEREESRIILIIVLETLAANLGSMATPLGNPQNLYLCSFFNLTAGDFFSLLLPYTALSLLLLCLSTLFFRKAELKKTEEEATSAPDKKKSALFFSLLALTLCSVFRILDWRILLAITLLVLIVFSRKTFKCIDYLLLLTFTLFFIFSHNISTMEGIKWFLSSLTEKSTFITALVTSQVISNVPAAVLLSAFTKDWRGLILGVDIGGLGTLIASLASLISFRFYAGREGAKKGQYIIVFTVFNLAYLIPLSLPAFCFS